jgi:hypothetical protein
VIHPAPGFPSSTHDSPRGDSGLGSVQYLPKCADRHYTRGQCRLMHVGRRFPLVKRLRTFIERQVEMESRRSRHLGRESELRVGDFAEGRLSAEIGETGATVARSAFSTFEWTPDDPRTTTPHLRDRPTASPVPTPAGKAATPAVRELFHQFELGFCSVPTRLHSFESAAPTHRASTPSGELQGRGGPNGNACSGSGARGSSGAASPPGVGISCASTTASSPGACARGALSARLTSPRGGRIRRNVGFRRGCSDEWPGHGQLRHG